MKKATLLLIVFSFTFYISPAQLTFKSMLDNINCASYGCFNSYMENVGFYLDQTIIRGDNLTEYFYQRLPIDSTIPNLFIIGQRADGVLNYFMLQTPDKSQYDDLYDTMINQHGYIYGYEQDGFELYNSAITQKQVAVRRDYNTNGVTWYSFMLYNRQNY